MRELEEFLEYYSCTVKVVLNGGNHTTSMLRCRLRLAPGYHLSPQASCDHRFELRQYMHMIEVLKVVSVVKMQSLF